MNAFDVRMFKQLEGLCEELKFKLEYGHDVISISKHDGTSLVLFENFKSVGSALTFIKGYLRGKDAKNGGV